MHIARQLTVLIWSYAALWLFQGVVLALMVIFTIILYHADGWTRHSTEIKELSETAKNAYLSAETKGRYAVFDDKAKEEFPILAKDAIDKISILSTAVGDNNSQTENAKTILESASLRFFVQQKMINSAQVVDGKLQSNPSLVTQGTDAQNRTLNAFITFDLTETELLNARYQKVLNAIWTIAISFLVLKLFNISASITAFVWTWRTLKNTQREAQKVRSELIDKTDANSDTITLPVSWFKNMLASMEQGD